jgi:hypothetical protein
MQTLQISEQSAQQLQNLAEQEHMSSSDLIERLIATHSEKLEKERELRSFFRPYQKDLTGFKFEREEANER